MASPRQWFVPGDARSIKLNLRKNVQFHSGREMTSDDVIYNLNRILDFKLTAGIITGFVGVVLSIGLGILHIALRVGLGQ